MLPQQGQTLWQRQQRNVCGRIERAGAGGCGDGERGQALASMTTKAPQAATRTAAPQALSPFMGDAVACLGSTG